jgi:uncharacterized protein (TIGR03643 family)
MSISRDLKEKLKKISNADMDRLIRMCWEDRTSFETIQKQFFFSENEVVKVMRLHLDKNAFCRWRRRIFEQGHLKHEKKSGIKSTRFKCTRQSVDGLTKGWK